MATYTKIVNRWDEPNYESSMGHSSFRLLLEESIAEVGMARTMNNAVIPEGADLSKLNFMGCSFVRQSLKDVNLNETTFTNCAFNSVNIKEARLYSTQFFATTFQDTVIGLNGNEFFGTIYFNGCQFARCDFTGLNMNRVNIYNCRTLGHNKWDKVLITPTNHCQMAMLLADHATTQEQRIIAGYPLIFAEFCWPDFAQMEVSPALRRWVLSTLIPHLTNDYWINPSFLNQFKELSTIGAADPLTAVTDEQINEILGEYVEAMNDGGDDEDDDGDDDEENEDDDENDDDE